MKIAVVYNRDSKNVINLFGMPNQERIGKKTIRRIVDALKSGGHNAVSFEGDKELVARLEEFMPAVLKGERPGMVFNLSYGIQGQARYTHVPSILEMVGIPYVGSGPLAHSLALDKVVSKIIFQRNGIPTADFTVLNEAGFGMPDIGFPLIVKPKNEAVSFGIRVVKNEKELREAAQVIFEKYSQPVLAEAYIDGREINVGILGNNPAEVFPPAEIIFGSGGPKVYSYEDKTGRSGRSIQVQCPAKLTPAQTARAQEIALAAFHALGCYDCARVDMRMDKRGNFYVLEINSLPSLGEHGSYTHAAEAAGLPYAPLVNRMVEVAAARYFGTPHPPSIAKQPSDPGEFAFRYLTQRRDRIEKQIEEWIQLASRTNDPVGLREAKNRLETTLDSMAMRPNAELSNEHSAFTWETQRGLQDGTLLVVHIDVPLPAHLPYGRHRRTAEWIYGDGVAQSRAPIVTLEYALRSLRAQRRLRRLPIGVLFYTDEGRDARYSEDTIRRASARARRVIVLRPGGVGGTIIRQRRGLRRYALFVEGKPVRLGASSRSPDMLSWVADRISAVSKLTSRRQRIGVGAVDVQTESFAATLPHRIETSLLMNYLDSKNADATEAKIAGILGKGGPRWNLELIADRPPMKDRVANKRLGKALTATAERWEIAVQADSSLLASVGGLVTGRTGVICGAAPVGRDLYTPDEAVQRISIVQRTLLLSEFLLTVDGKS
jgi:D-alanine-D-alanine ligase